MNPRSAESRPSSSMKRRHFLTAAGALVAGAQCPIATAAEPADASTMVDLRDFQTKRLGDEESLPPDKTALIIIDMITRFCDPIWMSGGSEEGARKIAADLAAVVPNIRSALTAFRESGGLVVHVVNAKWTRKGREVVAYQRGRDYDLFDTPAMSVIDELQPKVDEIVVRKVASSAFTGTGLDFLLRNAGIENVVLSGQFGNACVFYTLIQSREFGFSNIWLEDAMLYGGDVYKRVFEALVGSMWAKLASSRDMGCALNAARVPHVNEGA